MANHDSLRESLLRDLPAVHKLLKWPGLVRLLREEGIPRWALIQAVQAVLDRHRAEILDGTRVESDSPESLESAITEEARKT